MAISKSKMLQSMIEEEQLFSVKDKQVLPLPEKVARRINAYAYAIGCFYPGIENIDYIPGFTENSYYESEQDLLDKTCLDLSNLWKRARKSYLGDRDKNERLIKVFYTKPSEEFPKGDFCMFRQNPDTNLWYFKPGFYNQPLLSQIPGLPPGAEPDDLQFTDAITGESFYYNCLGYIAIQYKY